MKLAIAAAALALAGVGCIPEEGPMMEPGNDCSECHSWTASGTVYDSRAARPEDGVQGVRVHITDAGGKRITLKSNQAGNFYTAEDLQYPLVVEVERNGKTTPMVDLVTGDVIVVPPASRGSCNRCHLNGFGGGPPVPGFDVAEGRIEALP